ncbi:MAG: helix-turn-helix domain-containing protein [Bryobacteraceae bacterium]|nr:helix-turn-helix domain-containing protein [Bryobacteraceae bacterium]
MAETLVGSRIRQLREERNLSLRSLAEQAGFSAPFLSQVENGQASPSISSLEKIARALGVTLGEFFLATERPGAAVVQRADERKGFASEWSHAFVEVLGEVQPGRSLEAVMVTIHPGGTSGKRPHPHTQEQIGFVFSGQVLLTLDEQDFVLRRGDAVTLPPGVARVWRNTFEEQAQVILISSVTPPANRS